MKLKPTTGALVDLAASLSAVHAKIVYVKLGKEKTVIPPQMKNFLTECRDLYNAAK